MNSLNLLSAHVAGQSFTTRPNNERPRSYSDGTLNKTSTKLKVKRSASQRVRKGSTRSDAQENDGRQNHEDEKPKASTSSVENQESSSEPSAHLRPVSAFGRIGAITERLVTILLAPLRLMFTSFTKPASLLVNGFYDETNRFSIVLPIRRIYKFFWRRASSNSTAQNIGLSASSTSSSHRKDSLWNLRSDAKSTSSETADVSSSSAHQLVEKRHESSDTPSNRTNSGPISTSSSSDEYTQQRRSVRIRLGRDDGTRKRKQRKVITEPQASPQENRPQLTVATIKSPTSPASSQRLQPNPSFIAPPRPLVPRRQPSYSAHLPRSSRFSQKTLVIDLDETLIHSLAKGGRMSSGHMVEVKLNATVGFGGGTLGPQHPILYYVHKRPHCDEFLRKVCRWYNLVVFTASVQEYADPVIDWLEQERKFFTGRYYRQHCTYRNGAYIKDLSSLEPDLSKIMILDNSPLSYIFHEGR